MDNKFIRAGEVAQELSVHCYTGHLVTASRSDSYNIYFIQNVPPISGVPELSSRPLSRSFF